MNQSFLSGTPKQFNMADTKQKKLAKLQALEAKKRLIDGLPHLHGFKLYEWSRKFFDSTNQFNFLVGPNQCSKSSTMIRKCIHWATAPNLWKSLWRTTPSIFWYLYPSMDNVDVEVRKKWIPEFMPRGEFKEHPQYGWELREERGKVVGIDFKSGVTVFFKAYTQSVQHLMTGTVHTIFIDEELPIDLFSELKFRLEATSGYYHSSFTATLGQDFWRATMEGKGQGVPFPDALKIQISLYDCLFYEDGSPSFWTREKIQRAIDSCPNDREVQRRVFGKFVKSDGLRFPSFDRLKNININPVPIPKDWLVYAGVDIGSGGKEYGHPSAITFVGVNPNFREARVFKSWNGKGIDTTASDVLKIFQDLRGSMRCAGQFYDYSSKDFYTIAARAGESFTRADKTVEAGDNTVNSLFRQRMLRVDDIAENFVLISQLENLGIDQKKSKAVDDQADSLRYALMGIPWDWTILNMQDPITPVVPKTELQLRREEFMNEQDDYSNGLNSLLESEIREWNELYEA